MSDIGKCPVMGGGHSHKSVPSKNEHWWPNQVNLKMLNQNTLKVNTMDTDFDYASEFNKLDLDAVVSDLTVLMTDSQAWWPRRCRYWQPALCPA
jgi:catalase-peroxidase